MFRFLPRPLRNRIACKIYIFHPLNVFPCNCIVFLLLLRLALFFLCQHKINGPENLIYCIYRYTHRLSKFVCLMCPFPYHLICFFFKIIIVSRYICHTHHSLNCIWELYIHSPCSHTGNNTFKTFPNKLLHIFCFFHFLYFPLRIICAPLQTACFRRYLRKNLIVVLYSPVH